MFDFQHGQGFRIAALDDHGGLAELFDFFPFQIDGQIFRAIFVPEQLVALFGLADKNRANLSDFGETVADDDIDFLCG